MSRRVLHLGPDDVLGVAELLVDLGHLGLGGLDPTAGVPPLHRQREGEAAGERRTVQPVRP